MFDLHVCLRLRVKIKRLPWFVRVLTAWFFHS